MAVPGDGVRLAATRWPGAGTPVVLLHGLASQRRFWNPVASRLAGSSPLLALDQRGHGDSDRPADGPYDLQSVAADVTVAMDAVALSRAVVVGHSWGAAVAATFAAEHPQRCLSLVMIDGGFSTPPAGFDRAAARKRLEPPRFAMPPEELVAMLRSRSPGAWDDELASAVLPIFEVGDDGLARARLPFDIHMQVLDGLLDFDATATLSRVQCPTWAVSCDSLDADDDWTAHKRESLKRITPMLARPRVLRWGGAVHDVPLQWPDLVAGLIRTAITDAQTELA